VPVNLDIALAIVLFAVSGVLLASRYRDHWAPRFAHEADPEPERGTFAQFVKNTPQLKDNDKTAEPALLLVDRASKIYDEVNDATKGLEAKATTILGFVGGGASLYALSAGTSGAHPSFSVLLGFALAYFLLSLGSCLLCLVGRTRRGMPELRDEFANVALLNDQNTTKARVAAYLFMLVQDRTDSFRRINVRKSYYMELAQQMFALGVIAIVANAVVVAYTPAPAAKPSSVHCAGSGKSIVASKSFDCTT
jgi:hypothetical protein